jgi:hypothetical protein
MYRRAVGELEVFIGLVSQKINDFGQRAAISASFRDDLSHAVVLLLSQLKTVGAKRRFAASRTNRRRAQRIRQHHLHGRARRCHRRRNVVISHGAGAINSLRGLNLNDLRLITLRPTHDRFARAKPGGGFPVGIGSVEIIQDDLAIDGRFKSVEDAYAGVRDRSVSQFRGALGAQDESFAHRTQLGNRLTEGAN